MSSPERNQGRSARAEAALDAYFAHVGEERDEDYADVVDLITDCLHFAHDSGLDDEGVLRAAKNNFEAELDPADTAND
jgi:hypothetical protein